MSIITASQAFIRGTHPSSYRSGQWALIEGVNWITTRVDGVSSERVCYRIRFQDGAVDYCPVFDDDAGYEFTGSVTNRWPS